MNLLEGGKGGEGRGREGGGEMVGREGGEGGWGGEGREGGRERGRDNCCTYSNRYVQ